VGLDDRRQPLRDEFIDARDFWNESLGRLLDLDPDSFAARAELTGVPWRLGPLDPNVKHLVLLASQACRLGIPILLDEAAVFAGEA
jgi:hypothetical protein